MEQYVAYENRGAGKIVYPFLISMQHPVATVLKHVLVIPVIDLARLNTSSPPAKVCPVVTLAGNQYIAMTHMMAGIPVKELGEAIGDLSLYRTELRDAVEFLLNGY
ncbi:CcdB family protein [Atlantibacter sp.]|jgi:toxin CcdB|uniref:CcdB family protein n=1 Tax=Atlantibacter sp. TaxID=1903473 RepID=UPI0013EF6DD8|nr:CcdB family protein [Atlantibacter sp.]